MTTYDQFMIIAPYLIMGPGLFTGIITLGVMVQVSNAFAEYTADLHYFYIIGLPLLNFVVFGDDFVNLRNNLSKYNTQKA